MNRNEIIDISNPEIEFDILNKRLEKLSDRFLAVAMDYKHYIDSSFKENKIYELRDGVQYRFFSTRLHLEILLRQNLIIESKLSERITNTTMMSSVIFSQREISSIFDSIIYHSISIFDYISTLTNYISSKSQDTLMWTQLVKSVRDKNNHLSKKKFSSSIDMADREFVSKLYDHRSLLIHKKGDLCGSNIIHNYGVNESIEVHFFAGRNLIKQFKELKMMDANHRLSMRFVSFWILNMVVDRVTDILFSLKVEMESNKIVQSPSMFYLNPITNEKQPMSVNFWHESEYEDKSKYSDFSSRYKLNTPIF